MTHHDHDAIHGCHMAPMFGLLLCYVQRQGGPLQNRIKQHGLLDLLNSLHKIFLDLFDALLHWHPVSTNTVTSQVTPLHQAILQAASFGLTVELHSAVLLSSKLIAVAKERKSQSISNVMCRIYVYSFFKGNSIAYIQTTQASMKLSQSQASMKPSKYETVTKSMEQVLNLGRIISKQMQTKSVA